MKKYFLTGLAVLSIALAFGQNYVSGSIGLYGPSWNAATTIPTGGQALVSTAGNWWFAGIVTNRPGTGSFTFNGTGTYSNALVTSYTDGIVNYTNSSANFTFPTGDAGATVGGVYHPLMVSVASGTLTTSAIYNASGTTPNPTLLGAGVGKVDPIANWGFTSAAANATVTLTVRDETGVLGGNIYVAGYSTITSKWEKIGVATAIITGGQNLVSNAGIVLSNYTAFTAAGDALGVIVNIKVYLEGDMATSGTTMRNDLQMYLINNGVAILPTSSPAIYGGPTATYANINNPAGVVGNVVDWVRVDVRSAANPATILQSRNLLLKTDGTIVDVTGAAPVFSVQAQNIQLSVTHRNHLTVLSNVITAAAFTGTVPYDFSTGLAKAFNAGGDPAQMKLKNGVWTMITGDVNGDLTIDNSDVSAMNTSFNNGDFDQYLRTDLNMDGAVDNTDISFFIINFNAGYFSTLINY